MYSTYQPIRAHAFLEVCCDVISDIHVEDDVWVHRDMTFISQVFNSIYDEYEYMKIIYKYIKFRSSLYVMSEFYYDCLDRYLDRRDFELMQMDTDRLKSPLNTQEAIQIVKSTCRRLIKARINDCHDSTTQLLQDQITTKT